MATAGVPKIRLVEIAKQFDDAPALADVSFAVAPGQSVALIGGSGSGKSLTLKCILGLVTPDAGRVVVDGTDTIALGAGQRMRWMRKFGVLFQRQGLFDSLPVWRNVAFRLIHEAGMSRAAARAAAERTLATVGLDRDVGALYPAELSGGMQKRVGLARAIAAEPKILLLDEPTAGLDPIMTNMISDLINELVRNLNATVIAITSDMVGAERISERVVMLHEGRVVWQGATTALHSTDNAYVHQFVNQLTDGPIEMPVAAA